MITLADELRTKGWRVAVHNDYALDGEFFTFWLFTKGSQCVKGEGRTDDEAIQQAMRAIERLEKHPLEAISIDGAPCFYCKGSGIVHNRITDTYCKCPLGIEAAELAAKIVDHVDRNVATQIAKK